MRFAVDCVTSHVFCECFFLFWFLSWKEKQIEDSNEEQTLNNEMPLVLQKRSGMQFASRSENKPDIEGQCLRLLPVDAHDSGSHCRSDRRRDAQEHQETSHRWMKCRHRGDEIANIDRWCTLDSTPFSSGLPPGKPKPKQHSISTQMVAEMLVRAPCSYRSCVRWDRRLEPWSNARHSCVPA